MKINEQNEQQPQNNTSESEHLSYIDRLLFTSRKKAISDGVENSINVALVFPSGAGFVCAVGTQSEDAPFKAIQELLFTFSLAFELKAFGALFEVWGVEYKNMPPDAAEGMMAMQRNGALPRPSQHPNRVSMLVGWRGDCTKTEEGVAYLDKTPDALAWKPVLEKRGVDFFTLEEVDGVTREKLLQTFGDELIRKAFGRLHSIVGPSALAGIIAASLKGSPS